MKNAAKYPQHLEDRKAQKLMELIEKKGVCNRVAASVAAYSKPGVDETANLEISQAIQPMTPEIGQKALPSIKPISLRTGARRRD